MQIVPSLFFSLTECKLSRSGPPATIVAIDEESPNGKVYSLFQSFAESECKERSRLKTTVLCQD